MPSTLSASLCAADALLTGVIGIPEGCLTEGSRDAAPDRDAGMEIGEVSAEGPTAFCSCSRLQVARFFCNNVSLPQVLVSITFNFAICVGGIASGKSGMDVWCHASDPHIPNV